MQTAPDDDVLQEVLAAETRVWKALVAGDAGADRELLAESFLGVYGSGFSDREGHAAQLAEGPVVADFALSEARLLRPAPDLALLAYRARFHRPGTAGADDRYVSSLWQRGPGGWRNLFSQDTPAVPDPLSSRPENPA
ncbi:nuclear transport factor 2 family protein [Frigidibacter sp. ROC022]|uniref:nuclear transport factor 2 family protein n=1 Tax=Frigidibacter sp. ROC022 TaxID=2971796 RepID=UPI00215AB831|nr:nuclear transport factor 2 family protein [Frigidibacter sp. ROC022]MCR8723782.1 nuclear transport factor 2 family protein [Frigidibacter sp. ROC022]